jgi:SepF-like predicted cell division protein (DUF552 family)
MKEKREKEKIELPERETEPQYYVKIEKIIDSRDVERVVKSVVKGKIVLAKLTEIKNPEEFHLILRDLKRITNLYKLNLLVIHDDYALISKNLEISTL